MHIAICDDETIEIKIISERVKQYMNSHGYDYTLHTYMSGEELLNDTANFNFDTIFLDILMPSKTGTQVIKELKSQNIPAKIIITTTSREHAIEAFSLNVVHYLLKPIKYDDVAEGLDRCGISKENDPLLTIHNSLLNVPIFQKDIFYIEVYGKICNIHYKNSEGCFTNIETRISLNSICDELVLPIFIKPHRSFIVNMNYISKIENNFVYLIDDTAIPISRNEKKMVIQTYEDFLYYKL